MTQRRDGKALEGIMAAEGYELLIELVRVSTPFGIRDYDEQVKVVRTTSEDSALYKRDVSELLLVRRGRAWTGTVIGTHDGGGQILSLGPRYHPANRTVSEEPARRYWGSRSSARRR